MSDEHYRELHWHPTEDEWTYFLQGSARITVYAAPAASRTFGSVLHAAEIRRGEDGFLRDWALILVDEGEFDIDTFKGNRLFVGASVCWFYLYL